MKKLNFGEIIIVVLLVAVLVMTSYYYLIRPVTLEKPKEEVTALEKNDLILLTEAFLTKESSLNIKFDTFNKYEINSPKFLIAANYYYLLNKNNNLENYDAIQKIAERVFAKDNVEFENFTLTLDDCGKKKFSSVEGMIENEFCDQSKVVYEIKDVYKQGSEYYVEFYLGNTSISRVDTTYLCEDFDRPLSYTIKTSTLENENIYSASYNRCCKYGEECILDSITDYENELLNQVKIKSSRYKMVFIKNGDSFVYKEIKK